MLHGEERLHDGLNAGNGGNLDSHSDKIEPRLVHGAGVEVNGLDIIELQGATRINPGPVPQHHRGMADHRVQSQTGGDLEEGQGDRLGELAARLGLLLGGPNIRVRQKAQH